MTFDVFLHVGTLLAVITFFWSDLVKIFIGWFKNALKFNFKASEARLGWLLIIATIPAVIFGYFLENLIENNLRSNLIVAVMLIVVGALFLLAEKFANQQNTLEKLTWKNVLFIGCAQALALIPGTSRSGITIIAGMVMKLKREAALRFSFLMSAPIILGASIKKIVPLGETILGEENILIFILSFMISYIVGYLVIKYLLKYVANHSLNIFAYYRFALALVILLWFI